MADEPFLSLRAVGLIGRAPRRIIHDECMVDGEIVLGMYRGETPCQRCGKTIREGGVVAQGPAGARVKDKMGAHR